MRFFPKGLTLAVILAAASAAHAQSSPLQVKTAAGIVEGKAAGPVRTFLGIPYAAPPVGDLRWKPPIPAKEWKDVRKTTNFGARCMQGPVFGDMNFRDVGGSGDEDCLFLNVWTPAKNAEAKLPVMVWIHGGGFVAGASSEPRQDGEKLAANQNVVVVSMNYRLGIFGFFVHPELAKESGRNTAGNYGLLDQVAALRWVQENIASFGGDPGNVTIFGESAGSFSVTALMASPLGKGLFRRAIGESGGAGQRPDPEHPDKERATKDFKLASSVLGVQTLAELRAIPAQKLLDAFFAPNGPNNFAFGPNIDGYFLPDSAAAIYADGKQNDVPLLAGWNHDEGSFQIIFNPQKPSLEGLKATAQKDFGARADDFLHVYHATTDAEAVRVAEDYSGDRFIAWSTWWWIETQSKTGKQPVYRFRFDLGPPADPNGPQLGAYHSAEIEYVFGQLDSKTGVKWRPEDRQLSDLMQSYWANFARSGDPNGAGLPKWPAYTAADGWQLMILDAKSRAQKDDQRDRYLFLTDAWK